MTREESLTHAAIQNIADDVHKLTAVLAKHFKGETPKEEPKHFDIPTLIHTLSQSQGGSYEEWEDWVYTRAEEELIPWTQDTNSLMPYAEIMNARDAVLNLFIEILNKMQP